jgi:hypothetical protein
MSILWNKHLILKFYIFLNTNNQSNHEKLDYIIWNDRHDS